jgi:hypothetical protein
MINVEHKQAYANFATGNNVVLVFDPAIEWHECNSFLILKVMVFIQP